MTKRLFTFGCSYTDYYWPTWANFFGSLYDEHHNWGCVGGGNQFIFESLVECNISHHFNENDTIVVMWSTYQRFDLYLDHWITPGNIYNSSYSEDWIEKYWSIKGGILHSLNYISAAQLILDALNVEWAMASMCDLLDPFGEKKSKFSNIRKWLKQSKLNLFDEYPKMKKYETIFANKNMISPPLNDFCKRYRKDDFNFNRHNKSIVDYHPTPLMHLEWTQQILAPHFGIISDASDILEQWQSLCSTRIVDVETSLNYTNSLHIKPNRI